MRMNLRTKQLKKKPHNIKKKYFKHVFIKSSNLFLKRKKVIAILLTTKAFLVLKSNFFYFFSEPIYAIAS